MKGGLRRTWLVARREILQRTRSRAFRIATILTVAVAVGLVLLPQAFSGKQQTRRIGLVGEAPAALPATLDAVARTFDIKVELGSYPALGAGEDALRSGHVDVLLVNAEQLVWKKAADPQLSAIVTSAVQGVERQKVITELGLTPRQAAALLQPRPLRSRNLERNQDQGPRTALALVGLVLLFMAINIYGGFLLLGVVEEKSSRVVEVLLSRVRPYELLAGKVVGIGLVGLGQFVLVGGAALVTLIAVRPADVPDTTPGTIGWVLLWFVLGYAFYSVLYAAAGALVSRQEEAQSITFPVTMVLLVSYFVSFTAVESPDGLVAKVCSFLPPTAPLVMTVRIAQGGVAAWEILLSVGLLAAATYGLIRLGGRVYSGAILRVGPRVRLREAWRSGEG